MAKTTGTHCRHCGKPDPTRPRGLCWACSQDPAVRRLHPSTSPTGRWADGRDHDPDTMAAVDRIVAEQMAALPDWWAASSARMAQGDPDE